MPAVSPPGLRPLSSVLLLAVLAAGASAQVPGTVSPRLQRALARPDTTVLAWVVAKPAADLDAVAAAVRAAGGTVRRTSRFVHAVSARMPGSAVASLARSRLVRRLQPIGVYVRNESGDAQTRGGRSPCDGCQPSAAPALPAADTTYGPGAWAFHQLAIPALHALGLRGRGARIAMLDAGFNTQHPLMAGARVVAQRDFVYGDSVVRDQPGETQREMGHGTATWSLIAADQPGQLVGAAPEADFILAKTEYTVTETRTEEDNWVAAIEWAESLGVDVISSSLGYLTFDDGSGYQSAQLNGDVAVTTVAADSAAKRGTLVVIAVGNEGPQPRTLGTPADADSALAIGATDSLRRVVGFSSRGPTADGRIKPELVAPGLAVTVAAIDLGITQSNGTSFATPLVAGLAALVQGARVGRPALELRQGLLAAGSFALQPDNDHGWGIPDALTLYSFPAGVTALGPTDANLATVTPTFSWDAGTPLPGAGPHLFRVKVGADSALRGLLLLDTTVAGSALTLPFGPPPLTRLFWRVVASSPLGAAESTAVKGPFLVPPWLTLRTFASRAGQSIRDSLPLFVWSSPAAASPPGPFIYDVYVYPASRGPAEAVAAARGITDTTFRPTTRLERSLPYRWRVVAHLGADSVTVTSPGTFIVLDPTLPSATVLFQNFPNPFPNQALGVDVTCIWFDVAQQGEVRLEVFDLRGRLVRRLAPSSQVPGVLPPGRYGRPPGDAAGTCDPHFAWDGRDETGALVRPGVYLYRLAAPGFRDTKRVVFLGAP